MEYDEKYGAIACAQEPFNIILMPFSWLYIFEVSDKNAKRLNNFLCHMMYLP